jgi:Fur family transcriptional regulator, ferric uptake regulator
MQDICIMHSLHLLKQSGIKLTAPRKEVLKSLSSSPLSAQEVHQLLKQKGFNTDLVTVYRTLETFENLGLVEKIQFEDKVTRFELKEPHHHHLICLKCGLIEDIVMDEDKLVQQIEDQSQFKLEKHSLEFYGFCAKCRIN